MFAWKSCESKIIFDSFKLLESSEEYWVVCRFSKPQLLEVRSSNNNLSGIEWCERRWLFPSKLEDPRSGWRCLVELSWTKLGKIRLIGGVGVVHELIWHKWYKIYQNMMKKQDARLFLHFIIGFRCSECFPQLSWEDVQGHQVETVNKDENRWRCNRTFDAKKPGENTDLVSNCFTILSGWTIYQLLAIVQLILVVKMFSSQSTEWPLNSIATWQNWRTGSCNSWRDTQNSIEKNRYHPNQSVQ